MFALLPTPSINNKALACGSVSAKQSSQAPLYGKLYKTHTLTVHFGQL
jgi:hypothetical protein